MISILGLPFTCPAGIHMFSLFNQAAPSWNLILFALLEVIIVAWIYGVDKFVEHISEMRGGMNYPMKVIAIYKGDPPYQKSLVIANSGSGSPEYLGRGHLSGGGIFLKEKV